MSETSLFVNLMKISLWKTNSPHVNQVIFTFETVLPFQLSNLTLINCLFTLFMVTVHEEECRHFEWST